jgi:hypothetical protein
LEPDYIVTITGEIIGDFPFPFIAPLGTNDDS